MDEQTNGTNDWWPKFDPPHPYEPADLSMTTLAHLASRLLVHYEHCKCGSYMRGSHYSNERDSNPLPHKHRFWAWCPECQRSELRVLYHEGHQQQEAA